MSPYDCEVCGKQHIPNGPLSRSMHEKSKVHQAALTKQGAETIENKPNVTIEIKPEVVPVQKTVKTPIPDQPKTQKLDIKPVELKKNVENQKTEDEEWGGFFGD